jgi:hypothetical protein
VLVSDPTRDPSMDMALETLAVKVALETCIGTR